MPKTAMQAVLLGALLPLAACVAWAQGPSPSVLASSIYDDRYLPEYALDGDPATRWASRAGSGAPEWLLIDFSAPTDLADLTITWEHAYAAEYELQVSDDKEAWRALFRQPEGKGGVESVAFAGTRARYLRLWCTRPGPFPLASVWAISSGSAPLNEALHAAARGAAAVRERAAAQARRPAGALSAGDDALWPAADDPLSRRRRGLLRAGPGLLAVVMVPWYGRGGFLRHRGAIGRRRFGPAVAGMYNGGLRGLSRRRRSEQPHRRGATPGGGEPGLRRVH